MADFNRNILSEEYHELPEFLRFNKYGGVLDKGERERVAKLRGVCSSCGIVTHKVTPFRTIPLDNENVSGGVCLKCHPELRKVSIDASPPVGSSGKAAKILGGHQEQQQHEMSATISAKRMARRLRGRSGQQHVPDSTSGEKSDKKAVIARQRSGDIHSVIIAAKAAKHLRSRLGQSIQDGKSENDRGALHKPMQRGQISKQHSEPPPQSPNQNKSALCQSDRPPDSMRDSLTTMSTFFHSTPTIPQNGSHDDVSDYNNDAWDLVKEMRSNPDDVELLTRKCDELRNIGTNQAGSLYEIIEIMRRFPSEKSLQIASIGALWSLSADGGHDSKMEVLDAGGAEVIVEALRNFPEDVTSLSWGLGALSNLGEGMGGRVYLEEEEVINCIGNILKKFYKAKNGRVVFYWIFRCLVTLLCDYSESALADEGAFDINDVEEDFEVSERNRNTIANSEIVGMALLAIDSSPMDSITLEMAFKFFSHLDVESFFGFNRELLTRAYEKAIQAKPHSSCTTLHHLACATLCLVMKTDSSSDDDGCIAGRVFVRVALEVLTYHGGKHHSSISIGSSTFSIGYAHPHSLEVMVSTLSHLLCSGNTTLSHTESNNLLNSCCAILEYDESGGYVQGSCCWIIWSIFCYGPSSIKNTSSALKSAEAIQHNIVPGIESSPNLITVAFAALSEIAQSVNVKANPLVEMIVRLVSKHPDVEILHIEACRLLLNLCKTKKIAAHIISAGGLDLVKNPLDDSNKQCLMKVHLMIKLSTMTGDDLPREQHEAMINACARLKNNSPLVAKSWLGFLASSMTPDREDFIKRVPMVIKSINELLENSRTEALPNDEILQKCGCRALRNISVSIQQAELSLDTSTSITSVLAAKKEHGVQIHKECCDALWALMGVQCELENALIREVVYFAIEMTEIHVISFEHMYSDDIVAAGMAIFANAVSDPSNAMFVLGAKIIDIIVDVVNTTIYSYLDKGANHQLIFELGFSTLCRLCNDDLCREIIVRHGGIVAVIDGMMANLENSSIQENGCYILRRLGGDVLEMKLNIVEADGVDVIMNIMISHGENASVLSEAFQALSCLSVDKASRNFIAQQGGVMLIANSMSTLSESALVQEAGLSALCNLASDVDEGILQTSNIFSVVNNSLGRHAEDASIQRKGLALFYNLSMRSEGIQNELLSFGCCQHIITAMEFHSSCPNVVSSALRMLVNLSDTREGMELMFQEKAIKLIIHVMMVNVKDLKIAIVGCKTIHVICEKSKNRISIGAGGVEAILFTMMFHHSSEYVQNMGCRILSCSYSKSFMTSNGVFDAELFDLNCKMVDVLLLAMVGYPKSFEVQKNAIFALRNISKLEENIAILLTEHSRLEDLLTIAMSRFPACQKYCREVLGAIA